MSILTSFSESTSTFVFWPLSLLFKRLTSFSKWLTFCTKFFSFLFISTSPSFKLALSFLNSLFSSVTLTNLSSFSLLVSCAVYRTRGYKLIIMDNNDTKLWVERKLMLYHLLFCPRFPVTLLFPYSFLKISIAYVWRLRTSWFSQRGKVHLSTNGGIHSVNSTCISQHVKVFGCAAFQI